MDCNSIGLLKLLWIGLVIRLGQCHFRSLFGDFGNVFSFRFRISVFCPNPSVGYRKGIPWRLNGLSAKKSPSCRRQQPCQRFAWSSLYSNSKQRKATSAPNSCSISISSQYTSHAAPFELAHSHNPDYQIQSNPDYVLHNRCIHFPDFNSTF